MRYKIAVYLRVSTEEQALVQEGSLDSQRHRLSSFVEIKNAQEPGWGKINEFYIDEGISAKDTRRPAFQRMMSDIRKGKINFILVTDLARLSRNLLDFCVLQNDLVKYGAKFLSMKEQFDTSTAAGEMMILNIMNLAQFERKQTSERVTMNFHSRATRGLRSGGAPVLGYEVDPENKSRLVVNKDEAPKVKAIFSTFLEAGTLANTLRSLKELGIEPRRNPKRPKERANSGEWSRDALQNLLRNRAYIGLREINKKYKNKNQEELKPWHRFQVVKACWPAIIDELAFKRVQNLLDMTQKMERSRLQDIRARTYPLTGIVSCRYCGARLIGASATGANKAYRYYGHRQVEGKSITCLAKRYSADEVEEVVIDHLMTELCQPKYLEGLWESSKVESSEKIEGLEAQKREVAENLNAVEVSIKNVIRIASEIKPNSLASQTLEEELEELGKKKLEYRNAIQNLEYQILDLKEVEDPKKDFQAALEEARRGFHKASPAVKKRLLRQIFMAIIVSVKGIEISYRMTPEKDQRGNYLQTNGASEIKSGAAVLPFTFPKCAPHFPTFKEAVGCSPIVGNGDPGATRTRDLRLRRPLLYPTELPDRQIYLQRIN